MAETEEWSTASKLGDRARPELRGDEPQFYLDELRRTREATLAALAARDDAWLEAPLRIAPALNAHCALFHVRPKVCPRRLTMAAGVVSLRRGRMADADLPDERR